MGWKTLWIICYINLHAFSRSWETGQPPQSFVHGADGSETLIFASQFARCSGQNMCDLFVGQCSLADRKPYVHLEWFLFPGITAEVLVVTSFDELQRRAPEARGKIVVYNQPYSNYSRTVQYRVQGAVEAAKVRALASLIRSVASFSIYRLVVMFLWNAFKTPGFLWKRSS